VSLFSAVLGVQVDAGTIPTNLNVVIFYVDDLGWTDTNSGRVNLGNGSDYYETPALLRMNWEGLVFPHCYMQPRGAPSRAALLTGQYPVRDENGVYTTGSLNQGTGDPPLLAPEQNQDIPASTTTYAEMLQDAGYATAHFGKYQVGGNEGGSATLPLSQGFDFNFGGTNATNPDSYLAVNSGNWEFGEGVGPELDVYAEPYTDTYITNNILPHQFDYTYDELTNLLTGTSKHLTDAMADAVEAFIGDHESDTNSNQRFFIQYNHWAAHTPTEGRPDLVDKYLDKSPGVEHTNHLYAAMIEQVDQTLSRLLSVLSDPNGDGDTVDDISGETLILLISDNGGDDRTSNTPLRGGKGAFTEGGIRVPMVARLPGVTEGGLVSDAMVHAVDFYPTLADLANTEIPAGHVVDGESFSLVLENPVNTFRFRSPIFYHFPGYLDDRASPSTVVISDEPGEDTYKLFYDYENGAYALYNLTADIGESNNLLDTGSEFDENEEVAEALRQQMLDWLADIVDNPSNDFPIVKSTGELVELPGPLVHPIPPLPPVPNIVMLYMDDLGWTDLSTGAPNQGNGSDFYETPTMAQLASEGLSLTRCYMQPNGFPSRGALLTGQYPVRDSNGIYASGGLNLGLGDPPLLGPDQNQDIPASTSTLAEMLRNAGYITAHFGKYQVGGNEGGDATLPLNQGYDFNFGGTNATSPGTYFAMNGAGWSFDAGVGAELDAYADPYTDAYITNNIFPFQSDYGVEELNSFLAGTPKHLGDAMADAVGEFIGDHRSGVNASDPFFIHYGHWSVHTPNDARADLADKYMNKAPGVLHTNHVYGAMIEQADQTLARLLSVLRDPNGDGDLSDDISEHTLIILVSDNGGDERTDNAPLRGVKGMFTEGGIRVPMIARLPGFIPEGVVSDTLVHAVDFYPTLAEIAGAAIPAGHKLDGESFKAVLENPLSTLRFRSPVFYHFPGYLDDRAEPSTVMVSDDGSGDTYKMFYSYENGAYALYDLAVDIGETNNLLGTEVQYLENLSIAEPLQQQMVAWLDDIVDNPSNDYPVVKATGELVDPPGPIKNPVPPPPPVPNIVLLCVDDLGWTDTNSGRVNLGNGSDFYETPALLQMVWEGLVFTDCYMQPNGAPTRAALLTGQYPVRDQNGVYATDHLNLGFGDPPLLGPDQNQDVPASTPTYAEMLQSAGYVTAHFGKYQVGGNEGGAATLPRNQGFDFNYGGTNATNPGAYFAVDSGGWRFDDGVGAELDAFAGPYTDTYIENNILPFQFDYSLDELTNMLAGSSKHLTDATADAVQDFVLEHRNGPTPSSPFFIQYNHWSVHEPTEARPDVAEKYLSKPPGAEHTNHQYAAMIEQTDQTLARLFSILRDPNGDGNPEDDISEHTLILLVSDNGGDERTSNSPLRGGKGMFNEGGIRVPMIARLPGVVPAGQVTDTLVHAVDFYPTFADIGEASIPGGHTLDGESFWSVLQNPLNTIRIRSPIFYHFPGYLDDRASPSTAMVSEEPDGDHYKLFYDYEDGAYALYNLTLDIGESNNLLDTGPEYDANIDVAAGMQEQMVDWLDAIVDTPSNDYPVVKATGELVDPPGPIVSPVPPPPPLPPVPNIIVVCVDDLGWTDTSSGSPNLGNGSDYYETPAMTQMASEGLSFTRCYVQPNGAPTRAAFLTGQYPVRDENGVYATDHLNLGTGDPPLLGPDQNQDVPASTPTVAEMLQGAGYVTAHFGKYQVGGNEGGSATMPLNQGFDFNVGGTNATNPGAYFAVDSGGWGFDGGVGAELDAYADPYSETYITNNILPFQTDYSAAELKGFLEGTPKHLCDAMADAVGDFITGHRNGPNAGSPFFLQYNHWSVHEPTEARSDLADKYLNKTPGTVHTNPLYAAMIEQTDQTLARLQALLNDPNGDGSTNDTIASHTLIVLVSDNGGDDRTDNSPLRGGKGMFTDGGIRVPMIARLPGVIPAGTISDTLVHAVDFYPTFAEFGNADIPAGHTIDGESFKAVLENPEITIRLRTPVYYQFPGYLDDRASPSTVMVSDEGDGNTYKLYYGYEGETYELYNLTVDPGETNNLLDTEEKFELYSPIGEALSEQMIDWLNATVDNPSNDYPSVKLTGELVAPPEPIVSPPPPPNIVMMYVDDLGWTDTSGGSPNLGNGSDFYETPAMDSLADQGISFTSCYMNPNCSPSRAALLSGQYPPRAGNGVYVVNNLNRGNGFPPLVGPDQNKDVPASTVTIAEMLQSAGFVTAHFGKYHVGGNEGGSTTLPENQGFDYNFGGGSAGQPASYFANMNTAVWRFGVGVGIELDPYAQPYTDTYITDHILPYQTNFTFGTLSSFLSGTSKHLTDAMADAVEEFIDEHVSGSNAREPFFIHYSHYAVHVPNNARADLLSKYQSKPDGVRHDSDVYAAMIEQLDQTLARLFDNLADPNRDGDNSDDITGNTLLIFVSDNGGDSRTSNFPLRGRKGNFTEGGIRVPMMIQWPGRIPAGAISDTVIHAVDFYPTFSEITEAPLPGGQFVDGESFASVMTNLSQVVRTRSNLYYHFPGYLDGRASPSSIMLSERSDGDRYKLYYTYEDKQYALYNITEDISENNNLLDTLDEFTTNSPLAEVMREEMLGWLDDVIVNPTNHYPTYRSTGELVDPPDELVGLFSLGSPTNGAFRLTGLSIDPDTEQISLPWQSGPGTGYLVESSDDYLMWSTRLTNLVAGDTESIVIFREPDLDGVTNRGYRVVEE
jgi:arylsulfatase A-like enzyme